MITIAGVDFDYFMSRMIRYDEDKNLIRMNICARRTGETNADYFTVEIPGVNEHLERAFREVGWLNETPRQTEASTDRQVSSVSDQV